MAKINVTTEQDAAHTWHGDSGSAYVASDSDKGFVQVNVHMRDETVFRHTGHDDFVAVHVGKSEYQGVTIYLRVEALDQALALQKTANAAVRHLRKIAKSKEEAYLAALDKELF